MSVSKKKIPFAASLSGMPQGKGSRTKLIRVSGIPGHTDFDLTGSKKLTLEIWTESGKKPLGYLDIGSIPRWRGPSDGGKGKELYWENLEGSVQASHESRQSS